MRRSCRLPVRTQDRGAQDIIFVGIDRSTVPTFLEDISALLDGASESLTILSDSGALKLRMRLDPTIAPQDRGRYARGAALREIWLSANELETLRSFVRAHAAHGRAPADHVDIDIEADDRRRTAGLFLVVQLLGP